MDTGWLVANSARSISPGTLWTNANNAKVLDDVDATVNLSYHATSYQLNLYNFNANISVGNTILGIQVGLDRAGEYGDGIKDYEIYLKDDTANKGNNKADLDTYWPSSDAIVYYGDGTDLWGASWTVNQINASTFGVAVRTKNHDLIGRLSYVDAMQVKIYYQSLSVADHSMIMGM